ncbi:MAG: serine/threonine protein phosphatase [Proteobacteria bacterium]|nr:MAG: serine/threonine protein phosphatase [Pseudomonadota bacterium]
MLRFATETDKGHVRKINEDSLLAAPKLGLWVLADGVGGNQSGEIASKMACGYMLNEVARGTPLQQALFNSHKAIQVASENDRNLDGMATTIVACHIDQSVYQISWVGDSRGYIWNGSFLQQLTRDHSYIEQLVEEEKISRLEAATHPYRHVLLHALGSGDVDLLRVDTVSGSLSDGDVVLLCSDGLTEEVNDEDIARILESELDLRDKAHCLLETSKNNGGRDNISIILIQYGGN